MGMGSAGLCGTVSGLLLLDCSMWLWHQRMRIGMRMRMRLPAVVLTCVCVVNCEKKDYQQTATPTRGITCQRLESLILPIALEICIRDANECLLRLALASGKII